jgi:hypothetical protein
MPKIVVVIYHRHKPIDLIYVVTWFVPMLMHALAVSAVLHFCEYPFPQQ